MHLASTYFANINRSSSMYQSGGKELRKALQMRRARVIFVTVCHFPGLPLRLQTHTDADYGRAVWQRSQPRGLTVVNAPGEFASQTEHSGSA